MKWLWVVLLAIPHVVVSQTYSACPTPSTKTISVSVGDISATSKINVVDRPAPAPFIDERYGYADVQTFTASQHTGTIYANPANLQMERECGGLRYNFIPPATPNSQKYYSGYDLVFPKELGEAYIELWVRFDSAFVLPPYTTNTGSSSWAPNDGFVLLMGRTNNNSGAFGVTLGSPHPHRPNRADVGTPCYFDWKTHWSKQEDEDNRHTCGYSLLHMAYGYNVYGLGEKAVAGWEEFGKKMNRFDGRWHRYRFWFKAANGTYPNGASVSVWVDNDHLGTLLGRDTAADKLIGLSIGRFLWNQPTRQQYVEFGRVRVWSSNPGWNVCQLFCN